MQVNYKELLEEIKEITTADGFVASCLEIKESMFFYERDLMLAAFTASLELLAVAALFSASLHGKRELNRVETEVTSSIEELFVELRKYRLPLDIQYIVDFYLQDVGMRTRLRMPVYTAMLRNYTFSTEYQQTHIDFLLRDAHRVLLCEQDDAEEKLNLLLGQVGTKMLRGDHLRPIWLQISHPRIYLVLVGLQTMMSNFQVTPYFSFPLENISTERQKRKKIGGNVVLDLSVFRNFRQGGSGYTDLNVVLNKDDYDHFFDSIAISLADADVEPDGQIVDLIIMILEARLVNEEIDERFLFRLLIYCDRWRISAVSDVVLQNLALLDYDDPLFFRFWALLHSFGGKALPAIRRFIRTDRCSPLLPYLAYLLSSGSPGKRKWSLLTEMFEHYPHQNEDKAQLAVSLARYGGADAITYLETALTNVDGLKNVYRSGLEEALAYARSNGS